MATKAVAYMAELLRQSRPPRPKKVRKPTRDEGIDKTLLDGLGTSPHNFTKRAVGRGPVLESSATGKQSRKSTRKSSGHIKAATELTRRQMRRVSSPSARAARAAVR